MNFRQDVDLIVFEDLMCKLAGGSKDIVERIKFYVDHPYEFLNDYEDYCSFDEELIEDLIGKPAFHKRDLPGDIMYGLLQSDRYLWKVDWRESPDGIEYVVDHLLARRGMEKMVWKWSAAEKRGMATHAFLNAVADELQKRGLQLAFIDEDSDAYPLIIVPATEFQDIVALAGRLGLSVRTSFA